MMAAGMLSGWARQSSAPAAQAKQQSVTKQPSLTVDRDPVASPPGELPEVQVVATMLGGAWVHNPPPWD